MTSQKWLSQVSSIHIIVCYDLYYFDKDKYSGKSPKEILLSPHFTKLGQKKYVVFPINPTMDPNIFYPNFWPDPKVFIQIFLFLIKSCIIFLFVCQTRLGSLGVLYELNMLQITISLLDL